MVNARARAADDGPTIQIRATRDPDGLWRLEAIDSDTGAVVSRPRVGPNSRIGRALEALAAELAPRPRFRR
jgi:hypothetical protein